MTGFRIPSALLLALLFLSSAGELFCQSPAITSLSPTSVAAGASAFTLTVNGSGFDPGAVVQWNGAALVTDSVSATQLTAAIPAMFVAAAGTVTITVRSRGDTSNGSSFVISPPPAITSLNPSSATAGGAAFTLTVNGSNFITGAVVRWNTTALTTTFIGPTQLTATVPAALIAAQGSASVTVLSGGVTSSGLPFTINAAPPVISSLSPNSAIAGSAAFTLTVNGSNFAGGATVQWNGTALTTTVVSSTQLTAAVPAALIANAATINVTVSSGSGTSSPAQFTVTPAASIQSLDPTSATAGGAAFTLKVNGSNFASGTVTQWNGTALSTTLVNANQLTAAVPAALIATAGTANVIVNSGGVPSNTVQFPVAPGITSLNPNSATAGGPDFTLTVAGSGFSQGATVRWNGSALTTTFVSATQLTAAISRNLIANAGSANVSVNSGGVNSTNASFSILNGPTVSSISPNITTAGGGAFTLTVNGSGFTTASVVKWNDNSLPTSFTNPNQLTASVSADLVANPGTALVTVTSGGVTFDPPSPFTIRPGPAITSLSPPSTTAGGAGFTLMVNGSGFDSGSVVQWNGSPLSTTFVNANQLTAPVSAALIATAASVPVTVVSGGVTSNAVNFEVANGPSLTSLSPDNATAGASPFTLTLTGTGFNSSATVQWNGASLATTFVDAAHLTAAVPANLIASPTTAQITVIINGVSSNALNFIVSVTSISSLSPPNAPSSGQPFQLTVNGGGFSSNSVVQWNGTPLSTKFESSSQLTANVPGNLSQSPGSAQISVVSNGVTSNIVSFVLVYPLPAITIGGLKATATPTEPLSPTLQLASPAPSDLQGVLTLSFVPSAAGVPATYVDPALRFASGDTKFTFTVASGATAPAAPLPNIQQGTVAGQITVTLTNLTTGNLNVLPASPVTANVAVPPITPVIESCSVGTITNGAFSVQLNAYSTPRDLSLASYTFTAAPGAQIAVTTANGGQVTGTTQISVPVTTQVSQWFASSASQPNGSVFSLQAPFTLSGDASALQSVSVALTNSIGPSAPFACTR